MCSIFYIACQTSSEKCSAFLQMVFMGPKLTALKQTSPSSLFEISKRAVYQICSGGRSIDQRKVRCLVPKQALNSKRLHRCYAQNGFEMEPFKMTVVVQHAGSGNTVGIFYLPFRKSHAENGYGMEPIEMVVTLEDILLRIIVLAFLTLKAPFQQLTSKTKVFAKDGLLQCPVPAYKKPTTLNLLCMQLLSETREFAKGQFKRLLSGDMKQKILNRFYRQLLSEVRAFAKEEALEKYLVSVDMKPKISNPSFQQLPCEKQEFAKNSEDFQKQTEKRAFSTASDEKVESQTSDPIPDSISMKSVKTCDECRETIRMKKFFDERRFGILEKCSCVFCYGCIRKSIPTSNGVAKGPVRCPRCFVKSDKVASSAIWIEDEEKVEFFKEFRKNLQNTHIKLRLGWTSFPTRKDDMWTRAP